uniref:Transposase n=1 Tax=Micromonospora carbonacea TaxID=47853 RepID=A0A7D5YAU5_9ACTN|nr:transposase [Micromonospora carbonacea]
MPPLGRPSKCTEEFRRDAVDLVCSSGRPINQVARELGMSHETLRNWVRKEDQHSRSAGVVSAGDGLSVADKDAEIARLRREVAELRQEEEILRKAAAYLAKELIEAAQQRWRAVNAPHLVALVRAGACSERGQLVERPAEPITTTAAAA